MWVPSSQEGEFWPINSTASKQRMSIEWKRNEEVDGRWKKPLLWLHQHIFVCIYSWIAKMFRIVKNIQVYPFLRVFITHFFEKSFLNEKSFSSALKNFFPKKNFFGEHSLRFDIWDFFLLYLRKLYFKFVIVYEVYLKKLVLLAYLRGN